MRILGFSKKWDKLGGKTFTTFRFKRKDRDWEVGEAVQIIYKPRSKEREKLGVAIITQRVRRDLYRIGALDEEIIKDGFKDKYEMGDWLDKTYGDRWIREPMNKLTLRWINEGIRSKENS